MSEGFLKMRGRPRAGRLAMVVPATSCVTLAVNAGWEREADFAGLRTFAVVGGGVGPRVADGLHGQSYPEGSLVIDVLDPASGRIVWRGWATRPGEEFDSERVGAVVDASFPPESS